eukprot:15367050-Ditylum_brightwellii.AAC.1
MHQNVNRQSNNIITAMDQVINVLGDPFQFVLGWKSIRRSDVTKYYQQAAGLVIILPDEIEWQLIVVF